jgi:DNA-binding response OmpR family regulator
MHNRILVVDDEARTVSFIKGYLERESYEVFTASNGREALFAARDHQPDLIILDLMMPEMDGWEFVRQHRRERDTPIIMLTARVEAGQLVLDEEGRIVRRDGRFLELTRMEFDLLATLMNHPGRAFNRLELLERTQDFAYDGYERTIDVHIKNLRKKIESDPGNPVYILTVFGVGYRFNPDM